MRDYSRISSRFWIGSTGKKIKELGIEHQIVALYLMSSPHDNMIGLYYLPIMYLSHECGVKQSNCLKILKDLESIGFAAYDVDAEVVWVFNAAKYQVGDKCAPNQLKGVSNKYKDAPRCRFLEDFYDMYGSIYPLERRENIKTTHCQPMVNPLPTHDNSDTGTEQLQSTEQETEHRAQSTKVDDVWGCYQKHHSHARLGDKVKKLIRDRLKDSFTVDDLKIAIEGCHLSPHHCGQNKSNAIYQSAELIFRDTEHVNMFIDLYKKYNKDIEPSYKLYIPPVEDDDAQQS